MPVTSCACPNCQHLLTTTEKLPAQVWCNQCGASFFAERAAEATPQPPQVAAALSPSPVRSAPAQPDPRAAAAVSEATRSRPVARAAEPPIVEARPASITAKPARFWLFALSLIGMSLFVLLGFVLVALCFKRTEPEPTPPQTGSRVVAFEGTKDTSGTDRADPKPPAKKAESLPPIEKGGEKEPKKEESVPPIEKGGEEELKKNPNPGGKPKLTLELIVKVTKEKVTKQRALRLGVTPFRYDNMGKLLNSLGTGYRWKLIQEPDLRDANRLADYDVIFFTCNGTPPDDAELHQALRVFVENGGTLYASDFRFSALAGAFPGCLAKKITPGGKVQDLTAHILDAGLREAIGSEDIKLKFNSPGWKPACFDREKAPPLIEGWYLTEMGKKAFAPLLVRFPFGKGTVIFTSFHNSAQNTDTELKLLRYLVFSAVTAEVERRVETLMAKGEFSPRPSTRLATNPENPRVTQTYKHTKDGPLQFALGFANQGAKLRLTLVSPDGKKVEREGQSTFLIEIANAPAGDWQYTVTALEVPFPNFPFTLTVGVPSKK
jgi:hypothetical protein